MAAALSTPNAVRKLVSTIGLVLVAGVVALLWPSSLGGQVDYIVVSGTSMEPGLHTGDLVLVRASDTYEVGDEVAYRVPEGDVGEGSTVIHRIAGGDGVAGYTTQGDNRDAADTWLPTDGDVIGERWAMVPQAGRLLVLLRSPLAIALLAAALTLWVVLAPPASARAGRDDDSTSDERPETGTRPEDRYPAGQATARQPVNR
jgi:signal peptidase